MATDGPPVQFFQPGGSCVRSDGELVTPGLEFSPCIDGSSFWWNAVGYGFMGSGGGSTWTAHENGIPAAIIEQCWGPDTDEPIAERPAEAPATDAAPDPTPATVIDVTTTVAPVATDRRRPTSRP